MDGHSTSAPAPTTACALSLIAGRPAGMGSLNETPIHGAAARVPVNTNHPVMQHDLTATCRIKLTRLFVLWPRAPARCSVR